MGSMKSNLVPTTVTDKNGKVTTVHKRSETPSRQSSPLRRSQPSLPDNAINKNKIDRIQSIFETLFDEQGVTQAERDTISNSLHPETINRLASVYKGLSMRYDIDLAIRTGIKSRDFSILNNLTHLNTSPIAVDKEWSSERIYALSGIESMLPSKRDMFDFANPDSPHNEGIRTLLNILTDPDNDEIVKFSPNDLGQYMLRFRESKLAILIIQKQHQARAIIDIYKDHRVYDEELFETILNSDTPSLNGGIL